MKIATRLNSFLPRYDGDLKSVFKVIKEIGTNYVDLNYPEHTAGFKSEDMKALIELNGLKANGVALRFRNEFINGELGNSDASISNDALELCKEAADYCREIGGEVVTIWLGFDGFDYPFQIEYSTVWNQIKNNVIAVADYAPDLKISIEYKPFQPRAYAFIDSVGVALMMVNDINRDNVGITLDYCHMLMKHENPAYALDLVASRGKLFGMHVNDGYGLNDDGLMVGTSSFMQTIEFFYYAKLYGYDHAIYFDTFPVIENPIDECQQNIKMINKINEIIDRIGMDEFGRVIKHNSAINVSDLMLKILN